MIRRLGLGLTLLATGKMVFYDVSLLTAGSKIVAYFSFGILLLGISYLYQKVSSKMEEVHAQENKPNEQDSSAESDKEQHNDEV
ncbi:hypothetical protein D3C73_1462500 [compost metagenome]